MKMTLFGLGSVALLGVIVACSGDDGDDAANSGKFDNGSSSSGGKSSGGASSGDAGSDAGPSALQQSCTAIASIVTTLACGKDIEEEPYIQKCVADRDQRNGVCAAEYEADAACRAAAPASDYECVNMFALSKIGVCKTTGDALVQCIVNND